MNKFFLWQCVLFLPHTLVPSSCCLFVVLSLLLSMTHLPPLSDQNSCSAEDYLINVCILTLKLNGGNKHILNAKQAEKCLPKCYEFPQWKGSVQHSTKSEETASSFWTVAPWSKVALFPVLNPLCEAKVSFFVQPFLQSSTGSWQPTRNGFMGTCEAGKWGGWQNKPLIGVEGGTNNPF